MHKWEGSLPIGHQAATWTNINLLLIGPIYPRSDHYMDTYNHFKFQIMLTVFFLCCYVHNVISWIWCCPWPCIFVHACDDCNCELTVANCNCFPQASQEIIIVEYWLSLPTLRAKFLGHTWGPPESGRPQMGPMLASWTLLPGQLTWI